MSANNRAALIVTAAAVVVVAVVVTVLVLLPRGQAGAAGAGSAAAAEVEVLRDDTRVLEKAPDGAVEVVEFLDFECEACGAFHPVTQQLRQKYEGRVTFAYRYFPLPSHGNSMNAALAVEAAAKQDKLEPMYDRLFETQAEWGERGRESQAARFRGYADELGLDLTRYDADVADSATAARIESDVDDGIALGVQATPTFFVNGQRQELTAFEDLEQAIIAALD